MKNETQSPWQMILSLADSWTGSQLAWIALTIAIVFLLHRIAIRKQTKILANWMMALFWFISIIGWFFAMYMVMWKKIEPSGELGLVFLLLAFFLALVAILLIFRVSRSNDEGRGLWSKIISGVIGAIIVFGILAFAGANQKGTAMSVLMGGLLGLFIGQLYYNLRNMNADSAKKEADNKWSKPPPV